MARRKLKPKYIYLSDYDGSCMRQEYPRCIHNQGKDISQIGMREVAYVRYARGSIRILWADAQREAELRRGKAQERHERRDKTGERPGVKTETSEDRREETQAARREPYARTCAETREVLPQDTCTAALCLLCMCCDRRQRYEAAARTLTSSGSRGEKSGDK